MTATTTKRGVASPRARRRLARRHGLQHRRLEPDARRGRQASTSVTEEAPAAATDPSTVTTVLRPTATAIAEIERLLPTPSTAVDPPSPLRWENCGDRLQCGSLDVPLDAADPTGANHHAGVGSAPGHGPGRQNRHPDHQPRRPRRIRRRVPRQRRTLQRRGQPPLRHRLVGSPRRRRHRAAAVRVGLRRHVPLHRPRPPRRRRACRPRTSRFAQPSKPAPRTTGPLLGAHRYRRCRVGPRSDPAGARRRPDHLRRLLLRHPHRAPLRPTLPRRPAGDGARRRRRPRAGPRRPTRRHRRVLRPSPRRHPRRLRTRLPDHG